MNFGAYEIQNKVGPAGGSGAVFYLNPKGKGSKGYSAIGDGSFCVNHRSGGNLGRGSLQDHDRIVKVLSYGSKIYAGP